MIAAIVQARIESTRLPRKAVLKILGKPVLGYILERIAGCQKLEKVIVATTNKGDEGDIVSCAKEFCAGIFQGSEEDVLDRYYQAAKKFDCDTIVRITSDCPFVDPVIVDGIIGFYQSGNYDYVSNTNPPTFPDGLDVEVFSFDALERSWKMAKSSVDREHVNCYILDRPSDFRIGNYKNDVDYSHYRWTLDEERDLIFVSAVTSLLYKEGPVFLMEDILSLLERNPDLVKINQNIPRNEGFQKSVEAEAESIQKRR